MNDRKMSDEPVEEKKDIEMDVHVISEPDSGDDAVQVIPTTKSVFLCAALALVIFTVSLEDTIVATAVPTITTVFNSTDDVGWQVIHPFLHTYASRDPLPVGSIVCAAASSSAMLIVGRAIAGIGASGLFSGGMTIMGLSVPLKRLPIYIAVLASMYGIASVVGPILGGALTDRLSWRWCFWINLPFGGVALAVVAIFFRSSRRELASIPFKTKVQKVDIPGAVLFVGAIVCLLLALQQGGTTFPWRSPKIWGLFLGFGLLIIAFVGVEYIRGNEATLPPRILRQRTVLAGSIYTILLSMAFFTHIFFLPFYFQAIKGVSAQESGIRSIPYLVSVSIAAVTSGTIITKIGYYCPFMWIGAAIFTVGSGLLSALQVSSSTGVWIGYQIVAGFGFGLGMQVPFLAVQAVLDTSDMPTGNATILFCSTLGGSMSISIAQTIFSNILLRQIPKHTHGLDAALIVSSGATALRQVVPADQLQGVLEAYIYALQRVFILPIVVNALAFMVSFFVEWKSVKGKSLVPSPVT
ncbi:MFS general substrate transporter [Sanghuangporus baumii]|uniref:MFS general substrate transporter n=1 Tax=Sanghuangporus baumii TaxID=108892 RepID=A0A9Q5I4P3_SANBA|nr:MFS general substrate transporter [Sanghuangporus baumii]